MRLRESQRLIRLKTKSEMDGLDLENIHPRIFTQVLKGYLSGFLKELKGPRDKPHFFDACLNKERKHNLYSSSVMALKYFISSCSWEERVLRV